MADSSYYEECIVQLEEYAKAAYITYGLNHRCIDEVRKVLGEEGMSPSYRDQFIARTKIDIRPELSEEQADRVVVAIGELARNFYTFYADTMNFNDDAIALMGRQFEVILEV